MAVTSPAISRPPSAVRSSARLVAVGCKLRGHWNPAGGCAASSAAGPASGTCRFGRIRHRLHSDRAVRSRDKCCRCMRCVIVCGGCSRRRRRAKSSLQAVIDLKLLREDPDAVRRSQLSRGEDPALVDALLTADTDPPGRDFGRRCAARRTEVRQQERGRRIGRGAPGLLAARQGTRRAGESRRSRPDRSRGGVHRGTHGDLERHHRRGAGRRGGRLRGPRHRRRTRRRSKTRRITWNSASHWASSTCSAAPRFPARGSTS